MNTKDKLIEKYKKDMLIIDKALDDIDRNIKLAKKEEVVNKDVLFDMERTRSTFLSKWSCYEKFIKELSELNVV
jgi:hypothetical protein